VGARFATYNRYAHAFCARRTFAALSSVVFTATSASSAQTLVVTPGAPTTVVFSGFEGGPFIPQTSPLWTLGNSDFQSLTFAVAVDQPWLSATPASGQVPDSLLNRDVVVALNLTGEAAELAPGVYAASVSFVNLSNGEGNTLRHVELQVAPASFSVSPDFVNASATTNGSNPAAVAVTLETTGLVDLNYALSWPSRTWMSADRVSGTVPGGGQSVFNVRFNTFGLPAGIYTSAINVRNTTNGAGTRELPVTLIVSPAAAGTISVLPDDDLEVHGPAGNIAETSQILLMVNTGEDTVNWVAEADDDWITITPASGTLSRSNGAAGGPDEQIVEIRVNAARDDLPAGSHTATGTFAQVFVNPLTGSVNTLDFSTRLVRLIADPVLSVSLPLPGGRVSIVPPSRNVAGGTSQTIHFEFGDVVTLSASLDSGFTFGGWEADFDLDDPRQNPLVVTMDASKRVTGVFSPVMHELTLSTTGGGTGAVAASPAPVIVDNSLISRYNHGTQVRLTAAADDGSVFSGWAGNIPPESQLDNPLDVVIDRDRVIAARFEAGLALLIEISGDGAVSISPDLDEYPPGTEVTLTALPDEGADFEGWGGDASGAEPTLVVILNEDALITATFAASGAGGGNGGSNMAKLTVDIQGDGVVTPPGGNFAVGARVTLIATPGLNSSFVRWENGASGSELATVITMSADRTVLAVFATVDDPGGRPTPQPGSGGMCGAVGMLGVPLLLAMALAFVVPGGRRLVRCTSGCGGVTVETARD